MGSWIHAGIWLRSCRLHLRRRAAEQPEIKSALQRGGRVALIRRPVAKSCMWPPFVVCVDVFSLAGLHAEDVIHGAGRQGLGSEVYAPGLIRMRHNGVSEQVRPRHNGVSEQVAMDLVAGGELAGHVSRSNAHGAHLAHQALYALAVDGEALTLKRRGHVPAAVIRRFGLRAR